MQQRRILHADFNGFYASVACLMDPSIRSLPVAVAGDPDKRHGIILAKNEIAKKYRIKTGEAIWQAKQKCPGLLVVKPDFPLYQKFSALGREIYGEYSARVEAFGLDENWIDVTAATSSFENAVDIAEEIRLRIREELGVTVSVGVADNKIFAKLASDMKKPDAVTAIPPEHFRELVWPLPAAELLYVGRATAEKLRRLGILTIGDIAGTPPSFLKSQFGKSGLMLHGFANGLDVSPVTHIDEEHSVKSVGNGITAPRDLVNDEDAYLTIMMLSESVAARLREGGLRARTVQVSIRDAGLYCFVRQCRLKEPTNITVEIARPAMELFRANYSWPQPIRSLTVSTADLVRWDNPAQLNLFTDEEKRLRAERAESAVDDIRRRFGYHAIGRAIFLNDERIGLLNPKEENTIHPVGYLSNDTMAGVVGG